MRQAKKALLVVLFSIAYCLPAGAKELKMAIGLSLPPYIIAENNTGLELDMVRQALASKGYTLDPEYVPFARVPQTLEHGLADAAMTVNGAMGLHAAYFSDTYITYQNVAVTLKSNHITINSIGDLLALKIIAFQGAAKILGPKFGEAAKASPEYVEMADQDRQVAMLFANRTDVFIGDINIFKYYREQVKLTGLQDTSAEVDVHRIFPPTPYSVAFKDPAVRDDFNNGLRGLKASGEYETIIKKYIRD
jgi:polar amino acid transport system substrate-binding protein